MPSANSAVYQFEIRLLLWLYKAAYSWSVITESYRFRVLIEKNQLETARHLPAALLLRMRATGFYFLISNPSASFFGTATFFRVTYKGSPFLYGG